MARHQHNISGLNGDIGSGAHRHAHIGLRQRGRIVDPIAHIGKAAILLLKPPHRLHLALGHDLRHHLVYAQTRGNGMGGGASVASNHRHFQAQRMECRNGFGRPRLDRIGHRQHRGQHAVDGGIKRGLALCAQPRRHLRKGRGIQPQTFHIAIRAHRHRAAIDHAARAHAGDGGKIDRRAGAEPFGLRGPDNRAGDGMFGATLNRRDGAQHRAPLEPFGQMQVGQRRMPQRQRAGLVQRDDLGLAQHLQRLAPAKQHAHFRRAPGADHDRRGRGQPHRAGAGDNQHRHRIDQRQTQSMGRPKRQPACKGQRGGRHHCGHEPQGDPVDHRLNRQFRPLRRLDHGDDLREHRIASHRRGAKGQRALLVDRAAHQRAADGLGHRDRLAGDHRLIDETLALDHLAIDRDALAGADLDDVARDDILNGHFPAAAHPRGSGLKPHQPLDRLGRAPLGPRLQHPAQQDQRDNDRGGLVIDMNRAGGQQRGRKRRHQRIGIGRQRAHRDQRMHIGRHPQQRRNAMAIETPPRKDQHQRGQRGLKIPAVLHADGAVDQLMHARDQMRPHFHHEDRQGEHQCQQEIAFQFQRLCLAAVLRLVARRSATIFARLIARPGHRRDQILDRRASPHLRPPGGQIDGGRRNAGRRQQRPLDPAHAGGAAHSLDRQFLRGGGNAIARLLDRAGDGAVIHPRIGHNIGPRSGQIDADRAHPRHLAQRPFHPPDAGGAIHALNGNMAPRGAGCGLGLGLAHDGCSRLGNGFWREDGACHHGKVKGEMRG